MLKGQFQGENEDIIQIANNPIRKVNSGFLENREVKDVICKIAKLHGEHQKFH